jgi:cell division protein ZapA
VAQLTIEINGKSYAVGCEDGQEPHLLQLAATIDAQVRQVSQDVGSLGEVRLMLMGALLVADELSAAKGRMAQLEAEVGRLTQEVRRAEAALDAAAQAIDGLAAE